MYLFIVIALMLALPLISIVAQILLTDHGALQAARYLVVVAKWYVFWAVGVRLSLAGLRQIIQPRYTAETILGLKGAESLFFVRELGFANVTMGSGQNTLKVNNTTITTANFDGGTPGPNTYIEGKNVTITNLTKTNFT